MGNSNTIIDDLLRRRESKTLEFKRNCHSLPKILQTIVALSNTAGGTIVIGVDDDREVLGVENILKEEERLANIIADSIAPLLLPLIEIHSFRKKELIVVKVPCGLGPYYLKSVGSENGVYVRLGSTNRIADPETLDELRRIAKRISFDELPCTSCELNDVDWKIVDKLFKTNAKKALSQQKRRNLGLIVDYHERTHPTNAAVILFPKDRERSPFSNAIIRCARFKGTDKAVFIDQQELQVNLLASIEMVETFVARHTCLTPKIERMKREDIPEYNPTAIREAVLNAILHTDYSVSGCTITIAIFDDRIEITNPGALPHGMTLDLMTHGASRLRNKIIGYILKELGYVEQWGSGIRRILSAYAGKNIKQPLFEELGNQFRVTLFSSREQLEKKETWVEAVIEYLKQYHSIQPKEASEMWGISDRAAGTRLKKLVDDGILIKLAVGQGDPLVRYALAY